MHELYNIQRVSIGTSTVPVAVIHDNSPYQNDRA